MNLITFTPSQLKRVPQLAAKLATIRDHAIVGADGSLTFDKRSSAYRSITVDVEHPTYPSKTNRRHWPRLARLVAALRKPGEVGVGDTLARVFRRIGAKSMAHAYTLLTGEACRCAQRQRKLNERFPYGR